MDRVSFLSCFFMRFSQRPPPRLHRRAAPKEKGVRGPGNRGKVEALSWAMILPFSQSRFLLLLGLALLCLGACDPGFSYRPEGWEHTENQFEWQRRLEGFEIRTRGLGGLVGSDGLSPELTVTNRSAVPLVLETAELRSGGATYPAHLPGSGEVKWRTVMPGARQRITLFWKFEGRAAFEVLDPKPMVILRFRQGEQPRTLAIQYTKDE